MQSTDVLQMEFESGTFYTMFNAFHHFTDDEKVKMVKAIQKSGAAAFIVEILEPTFFCLLKIVFTTLFGSLILSPFIRPFSLKRLFVTYILPINIVTITFDGIVSVLKSSTVQQFQDLFGFNQEAIKIFRLNGLTPLVVIQINGAK